MSNKSGTSMSGVVNTNKVKTIACDCTRCFHFQQKGLITYCKHYDTFEPEKKRTKCARYYPMQDTNEKRNTRKRKKR